MLRRAVPVRQDWKRMAEASGFDFHSPGGTVYWDESHCYALTLAEIENGLEGPASELEGMCLDVASRAVIDDAVLTRLGIPEAYWSMIAASWKAREPGFYGRMDFCFDGTGPAKLYEYNADTPTSLYESSVFQWMWLEELRERGALPAAADQFNSLHERLVDAFHGMGLAGTLHLAATGASTEDMGTIAYLADCAAQAGVATDILPIEEIGLSADGRFTDTNARAIATLFKLYPWEWLLAEDFARHIAGSRCRFIEPAWKALLSNKGLMPLLWDAYRGHPNLLPAYFEGDPRAADLGARHVRKPLYSREGANIEITLPGRIGGPRTRSDGPYGAEGHIVQAYQPLPRFQGRRPVCGVWLVGGIAAGLGIREGDDDITTDAARFVPHVILD